MEIFALIAFLGVGALAGLIGGLLGLSGGVVTVPALFGIFHLIDVPQDVRMQMAIGTSLSAMILTGLASTWAHNRHEGVIWNIVFSMLPGILLGCLLGAFVSDFLSGVILQIVFGLFVCVLGAYVLLQKKRPKPAKRPPKTVYTWLGLGIGSVASLLGIGGGIFTVPLLISYRFPEKKAIGTSAAVGLFITTIASLAYLYFGRDAAKIPYALGYIYLPAFALVGLATIFFAPLGVKLAHRLENKTLRRVFAGTLILVGILMALN